MTAAEKKALRAELDQIAYDIDQLPPHYMMTGHDMQMYTKLTQRAREINRQLILHRDGTDKAD